MKLAFSSVRTAAYVGLALLAVGVACHSTPSAPGTSETPVPGAPALLQVDCDPMVPTECGMPFPSSVWTTPDSTTATGVHVYFGATSLPEYKGNTHVDPSAFADRDGFSPGGTIMTHMPGATVTGLPTQNTFGDSVMTSSPTIVMEAATGALLPHFAELDASTEDTTRQAFMIRPAVRMKDATRYIVAIRHVVDMNGVALPVNPVFEALRDNAPSDDISVPPRRALYADIMAKLAANGVQTSDLQIAWDFTTASADNTTKWLIHMRDDALAKVGTDGPAYTITKVEENPNPYIRRRITGNMTVPYYLTQAAPGGNLSFGSDGLPQQNGTATFQFLVHIPNRLVNTGTAGPIIANAHGLLGDLTEGEDDYLAEICDREGYVAIAVDLIGMDTDDENFIISVITSDVGGFKLAIARQHQGLLNELLSMRMMMGKFATDPQVTFNGKSVIDPTRRYYRGDSQGGIFGGTYMSISTDVTRGLLGEPGSPYNMLLNRSADFASFFLLLRGTYSNPLDVQLDLGLVQMLWDRTEPDGYIAYMNQNMLPCAACTGGKTPEHQVIMAMGLGDQQVTPLGAHFIARTIGAKNLKTVNRELYGIEDADSGFSGSGMVEWNFGLPPAPLTDTPPSAGTDPHDLIRYIPASQDAADHFFRTGQIIQTCANGGPCASMDSQVDAGAPTGVAAAATDAGATDAVAADAGPSDAKDGG